MTGARRAFRSHNRSHNRRLPRGPRRLSAFTLIELLIVAVLIALFAAITVPELAGSDDEARAATAFQAVRAIARQIEQHREPDGTWPGNIEPAWFRGYKLPVNPLHPDHNRDIRADVDGSNNADKWHPSDKTTTKFPFWYNPRNGAFRVRVPVQDSDAATLALYNLANNTEVPDLGATAKVYR